MQTFNCPLAWVSRWESLCLQQKSSEMDKSCKKCSKCSTLEVVLLTWKPCMLQELGLLQVLPGISPIQSCVCPNSSCCKPSGAGICRFCCRQRELGLGKDVTIKQILSPLWVSDRRLRINFQVFVPTGQKCISPEPCSGMSRETSNSDPKHPSMKGPGGHQSRVASALSWTLNGEMQDSIFPGYLQQMEQL